MRISDWSSDVCSSDLHNGLGIGAAKADVASMALLPCRRHHFNPRPAEPGNQPLRQGADMGGNGLDAEAFQVSEGFLQQVGAEVVCITVLEAPRVRLPRSDERRVGKVCVNTFRCRVSPSLSKKKKIL